MTDYGALLRDHVTLRCRSIDRIFLQAYVPRLQAVGDVCTFLRWQRRYPIPSSAAFGKIGEGYVKAVYRFAEANHIPVIHFKKGEKKDLLPMFSNEASRRIEGAAVPLNWKVVAVIATLFILFAGIAAVIADGVPVRSLGSENYSIIFLLGLNICCSLSIVEAYRFYHLWNELKQLLVFLDRLPLRRTLATLRGFSWGSVWKMSGNVLEVRYKVISRQLECMNHTIATLQETPKQTLGVQNSLDALEKMRRAGLDFADWYSKN